MRTISRQWQHQMLILICGIFHHIMLLLFSSITKNVSDTSTWEQCWSHVQLYFIIQFRTFRLSVLNHKVTLPVNLLLLTQNLNNFQSYGCVYTCGKIEHHWTWSNSLAINQPQQAHPFLRKTRNLKSYSSQESTIHIMESLSNKIWGLGKDLQS